MITTISNDNLMSNIEGAYLIRVYKNKITYNLEGVSYEIRYEDYRVVALDNKVYHYEGDRE